MKRSLVYRRKQGDSSGKNIAAHSSASIRSAIEPPLKCRHPFSRVRIASPNSATSPFCRSSVICSIRLFMRRVCDSASDNGRGTWQCDRFPGEGRENYHRNSKAASLPHFNLLSVNVVCLVTDPSGMKYLWVAIRYGAITWVRNDCQTAGMNRVGHRRVNPGECCECISPKAEWVLECSIKLKVFYEN